MLLYQPGEICELLTELLGASGGHQHHLPPASAQAWVRLCVSPWDTSWPCSAPPLSSTAPPVLPGLQPWAGALVPSGPRLIPYWPFPVPRCSPSYNDAHTQAHACARRAHMSAQPLAPAGRPVLTRQCAVVQAVWSPGGAGCQPRKETHRGSAAGWR